MRPRRHRCIRSRRRCIERKGWAVWKASISGVSIAGIACMRDTGMDSLLIIVDHITSMKTSHLTEISSSSSQVSCTSPPLATSNSGTAAPPRNMPAPTSMAGTSRILRHSSNLRSSKAFLRFARSVRFDQRIVLPFTFISSPITVLLVLYDKRTNCWEFHLENHYHSVSCLFVQWQNPASCHHNFEPSDTTLSF